VPFVLLLAAAFSVTSGSLRISANFLVNGLFELFVVDDGSDFALVVGRPIGCGHLRVRVAHVNQV